MKTVDLKNPVNAATIIGPCCERARGAAVKALPTIRADTGEYGYVLDTGDACDCPSRWINHDWRKGHAEFSPRRK